MTGDELLPGDLVAVHAPTGRQEGVVLDSYLDYAGRQIVKVQLGPGDVYHAWYPTITRVKRTIYTRPQQRTFERHVYW